MKVLMQGRFGLLDAMGGDRIQVENTARELRNLGVDVDISTDIKKGLSGYDLVHVFQLDWTPETHFMAKNAYKAGKPLVFSPIHHKVSEVKKFDEECVYDYRRVAKYLFKDQHSRDSFKNIYRSLTNPKKIYPTLKSLIMGLKNMHIKTLKMCDAVLVQTGLEASDLVETYGVEINWIKVPNGVGEKFLKLEKSQNPLNFDDYIFSVGRVEPRKNQLAIIKAINELREELNQDLQLVIVGSKNPRNHFEYTMRFNKLLDKYKWITYIEKVPYKDIPYYFKHAKVCISASWFETTGLTLLEALYCGTNAVASSPRAKEILGDLASYCDPSDYKTIAQAVKKELAANRPEISNEMREEYTWENAAKKTFEVYDKLLEEN